MMAGDGPMAGYRPRAGKSLNLQIILNPIKPVHHRFTMILRETPEYRMVGLRADHWGPITKGGGTQA
jgi:hypothetical protein